MDRAVKASMVQSLALVIRPVCCLVFLSAAIGSTVPSTSPAEPVFTEEQENSVDQFINSIIACRPAPGLVISVVRGESSFSRAYGKADVHRDINATTDSIFCLASLTKAFTATLLSDIIPKHYPATLWDTRVKDVLGDSFRFVDDVRTELTTLKDLLSHRTGLTRGDLGIYGGYPGTVTRRQLAHRLSHLKARFGFRDKMLYNNWMYMLAGFIAEELSNGEPWESLVVRKLLKPLGMTSTVFLGELKRYVNTTLAVPYRVVDDRFHPFPLEHYSFHPEEPAASLCSTGKDMIKWMQFLLNIKSFGVTPQNLANTSAFRSTMESHMVMETRFGFDPPLPGNPHSYGTGFGWVIGGYRGDRIVNHAGALLASSSMLWLIPDKNTGIFVASNRQSRDPLLALITYYIADILSGDKPWLNQTTSCTFPEPWLDKTPSADYKPTNHIPHRPLEEYTGMYGNKLFGDFNVILINEPDEHLEIRYGERLEGVLIPSATRDTFSVNLTGVYWFLTHKSPIPDAVSFLESDDGSLRCLTFFMQHEIIEFHKGVRFNGWRASGAMFSYPSLQLLLVFVWLTHVAMSTSIGLF